jgi:hypothetical protein
MRERQADVAIIGGGLGGCAAALAALSLGMRVVLTEVTDWLGGQLTAQAVPPNEHPWIEHVGCTAGYRRLRDGIRDYYRRHYPLSPAARDDPFLNPGQGEVSPICHEPRVGLAVLEAMLQPWRSSSQLEVLMRRQPIGAEVDGDHVRAVTCRNLMTGDEETIQARYVLDATELGELLPLAGVEHVIGSESQDETGEPHALPGPAQPLDQQAISWCFALDHLPGRDHAIPRPEDYDFWRDYAVDFWPGKLLSWTDWHPETLERRFRPIFDGPTERLRADDLWHFRRILYRGHYPAWVFPSQQLPLPDPARSADPAARGELASCLQESRCDAYHQWLLPSPSSRVEHRRGGRRAGRPLPRAWPYSAPGPQQVVAPGRLSAPSR